MSDPGSFTGLSSRVRLLPDLPRILLAEVVGTFGLVFLGAGAASVELKHGRRRHGPDPAIFRLAAERIAVPIPHCFFIDDRIDYLAGAVEVGMPHYHFQGIRSDVRPRGDRRGGGRPARGAGVLPRQIGPSCS